MNKPKNIERLSLYSMPSIALVVLFLYSAPSSADYEKGYKCLMAENYSCAFKELMPLAKNGDWNAQKLIGGMYHAGHGVEQDSVEASKWYKLAVEQGHEFAQYNLATMYLNGDGVGKDYGEAYRLYRLSAQQGNDLAQNNLGAMYRNGDGVGKDLEKAVTLFGLSANQGNLLAKENIEQMIKEGEFNYESKEFVYRIEDSDELGPFILELACDLLGSESCIAEVRQTIGDQSKALERCERIIRAAIHSEKEKYKERYIDLDKFDVDFRCVGP